MRIIHATAANYFRNESGTPMLELVLYTSEGQQNDGTRLNQQEWRSKQTPASLREMAKSWNQFADELDGLPKLIEADVDLEGELADTRASNQKLQLRIAELEALR